MERNIPTALSPKVGTSVLTQLTAFNPGPEQVTDRPGKRHAPIGQLKVNFGVGFRQTLLNFKQQRLGFFLRPDVGTGKAHPQPS